MTRLLEKQMDISPEQAQTMLKKMMEIIAEKDKDLSIITTQPELWKSVFLYEAAHPYLPNLQHEKISMELRLRIDKTAVGIDNLFFLHVGSVALDVMGKNKPLNLKDIYIKEKRTIKGMEVSTITSAKIQSCEPIEYIKSGLKLEDYFASKSLSNSLKDHFKELKNIMTSLVDDLALETNTASPKNNKIRKHRL